MSTIRIIELMKLALNAHEEVAGITVYRDDVIVILNTGRLIAIKGLQT